MDTVVPRGVIRSILNPIGVFLIDAKRSIRLLKSRKICSPKTNPFQSSELAWFT